MTKCESVSFIQEEIASQKLSFSAAAPASSIFLHKQHSNTNTNTKISSGINIFKKHHSRGEWQGLYCGALWTIGISFLSYLRLTEVLVMQGKFVSELVWSHCVWKGFRLSGVEQSPSTLYIQQSNNKRINLKMQVQMLTDNLVVHLCDVNNESVGESK